MRKLVLAPLLLLGACSAPEPAVSGSAPEATPEELAQRWLDGHTRTCMKNADCGTNLCDRSLSLWDDEQIGICISLFRAQERWQRLVVASSIVEKSKDDPRLVEALWAGVEAKWAGVHDIEQLEGMFLFARQAATERSREFVKRVLAESEGSEHLQAGIALAKMGDPAGMDAVVEASASSQPVLRVHAAWGASKICSSESLAVIETLASDPHPVVRQAAYLSLDNCKSAEGEALRSKLRELAAKADDTEPGAVWLEEQ